MLGTGRSPREAAKIFCCAVSADCNCVAELVQLCGEVYRQHTTQIQHLQTCVQDMPAVCKCAGTTASRITSDVVSEQRVDIRLAVIEAL